jgi:hypothetical protein
MLRTWLVEVSRILARDAVREGMLAGIHDAIHELGIVAGDAHADPVQAADQLRRLVAQTVAGNAPQGQAQPGLLGNGSATAPATEPAQPLPEVSPREQIARLKAALEAGQTGVATDASQQLPRRQGRPRKDGAG